jgi:hypothetical protein
MVSCFPHRSKRPARVVGTPVDDHWTDTEWMEVRDTRRLRSLASKTVPAGKARNMDPA